MAKSIGLRHPCTTCRNLASCSGSGERNLRHWDNPSAKNPQRPRYVRIVTCFILSFKVSVPANCTYMVNFILNACYLPVYFLLHFLIMILYCQQQPHIQ